MQTTTDRALVLGGGGSTGNAWLVGVAAGLAEAGIDVTAADLTIGTSAGSTAAAHLVGGAPAERYASVLGEQPPPQRPRGGLTSAHLDRLRAVIEASVDLPDYRRADRVRQRWRCWRPRTTRGRTGGEASSPPGCRGWTGRTGGSWSPRSTRPPGSRWSSTATAG